MIENHTWECELCHKVFDDWAECDRHETEEKMDFLAPLVKAYDEGGNLLQTFHDGDAYFIEILHEDAWEYLTEFMEDEFCYCYRGMTGQFFYYQKISSWMPIEELEHLLDKVSGVFN